MCLCRFGINLNRLSDSSRPRQPSLLVQRTPLPFCDDPRKHDANQVMPSSFDLFIFFWKVYRLNFGLDVCDTISCKAQLHVCSPRLWMILLRCIAMSSGLGATDHSYTGPEIESVKLSICRFTGPTDSFGSKNWTTHKYFQTSTIS